MGTTSFTVVVPSSLKEKFEKTGKKPPPERIDPSHCARDVLLLLEAGLMDGIPPRVPVANFEVRLRGERRISMLLSRRVSCV